MAYWSKALADGPLCAGRKVDSAGAVRHGNMSKCEVSGPGPWHLTELRLVPGSSVPLWRAVLTGCPQSHQVS